MIVVGLLAAATGSWTGAGTVRVPLPTSVVESRDIIISDRADGAVVVSDAGNATFSPDVLKPGTNGFVRVAASGLAFTRQAQGIGREPPFKLIREADDRMWLLDPSTGKRVDLNAFGPQNRAVFVQLLPSAKIASAGRVAP